MKFVVALLLLLALIVLVRRRLLIVDHYFPLFGAIVILGFAAINDTFIDVVAASLGIVYAPLAIILIAIFIVLALVTLLAVFVSRLRHSQVALVRRFAEIDLDAQESRFQNTK
jgi:hypothetical protein